LRRLPRKGNRSTGQQSNNAEGPIANTVFMH
jgi:hypothetical protein